MHENHLINETSPYLQQHAHNPVDWFPWGQEAFEKARAEDKPIFLSIGYSTCHWCHVMEHESFEDEATARVMNENFISIKVDREERPDIDAAYMNFVVAMTGSGGWPLNVFLTPDRKPFYGGTYFPSTARYNMTSFTDVLNEIARKYHDDKQGILDSTERITNALQESVKKRWDAAADVIDAAPIENFNEDFVQSFDPENGGNQGTPKFPITLEILFNFYQKKNIKESLRTLKHMGNGGIFDHIEGGFHRYSVDERWLVPHFEKMLYDNALLLDAFSQAYLLTSDIFYKEKAALTFNYLKKRLYTENGFYSAQDADSEGEEGKYYVFTLDEIKKVVKNFDLFKKYYNITKQGNFEGKNILNVDPVQGNKHALADMENINADRARLLEYRDGRVPPGTDTKIVTFWNGLAISGLVRYATACDDADALAIASQLGLNYITTMVDAGSIQRVFGKDTIPGFLEDHAALANAFLDLHEATSDPRFLDAAKQVIGRAVENFWQADGFLPESGKANETLFAQDNRVHDAVTPSGASLFLLALFKLNEIEPGDERSAMLETGLKAHYPAMASRPASMVLMLQVLWGFLGHHRVITVPESLATDELLRELFHVAAFDKTVVVSKKGGNHVIVCTGAECKMIDDVSSLRSMLENS